MRWIVAVLLSLVVGLGIAWGDPLSLGFTSDPDPPTFQIGKEPTFKMTWYEKEGYLEVKGKNIHLRIHKCGKVEKLEWKEINKNEERQETIQWGTIQPIPMPYNFGGGRIETMPGR